MKYLYYLSILKIKTSTKVDIQKFNSLNYKQCKYIR